LVNVPLIDFLKIFLYNINMKKKIILIIFLLLIFFNPLTAKANEEYTMTQWYTTTSNCGSLGYWVYKPAQSDYETPLPLILYLHGIGERGNDLNKLLNVSLPMYLYNGDISVNAIVVMPQCPTNKIWTDITDDLIELLTTIEKDNNIDLDRVSVTGHSLGGIGTWTLAMRFPQMFSCIVPVSSIIQEPESVELVSHLSAWVFHGENDSMSYASVVNAQPRLPNMYISILKGRGHTITDIYIDEEYNILEWMTNHTRGENNESNS